MTQWRLLAAGATFAAAVAGVTAASLVSAQAPSLRDMLNAIPLDPQLGGDTTRVTGTDNTSFTFLATNAGEGRMRVFQFGNRIFNTNWVQAPGSVKAFDGLGPVYNRVSCAGCHTFDGRGRPPEKPGDPLDSMLVRLSIPGEGEHGEPKYNPNYGDQLNEKAIQGVPAEGQTVITYDDVPGAYGDGEAYTLRKPTLSFQNLAFGPLDGTMTSARVAPQMIGLGLLESVPDETLLALADPDDKNADGIHGHVNMVWSDTMGHPAIGRFGWKDNVATLRDQTVNAALGDIGITTSVHPKQNCPDIQTACKAAYAQPDSEGPEMSDVFLQKLVIYVQTLAVPRQRDEANPLVVKGEQLFRQAGCSACHVETLKTGADASLPELANQTIHPFTDLLLHDMGPGLADGRPDYKATGSEWRTPPLWGLGLVPKVNGHNTLLHDGRARGFAEAILWHGGEAEKAKEVFRTMSKDDRTALIDFLKSL